MRDFALENSSKLLKAPSVPRNAAIIYFLYDKDIPQSFHKQVQSSTICFRPGTILTGWSDSHRKPSPAGFFSESFLGYLKKALQGHPPIRIFMELAFCGQSDVYKLLLTYCKFRHYSDSLS